MTTNQTWCSVGDMLLSVGESVGAMGLRAADITALRDEAAAAGDAAQVRLCTEALAGSEAAARRCARAIAAARAQID